MGAEGAHELGQGVGGGRHRVVGHDDGGHGGVVAQRGGLLRGGVGNALQGLGQRGDSARNQGLRLLLGELRLGHDAVHQADGLHRVLALGGLSGEHDAVAAVEDRIGNVGALGTGGAGVLLHGLEHLSRHDHGLAGDVASAYDFLLHVGQCLHGDLHR
eukprot:Colp12_sorted_trinity150504_noHs@29954